MKEEHTNGSPPKLTTLPRSGGWFYTTEGMERLKKGGMKRHLQMEKNLAEKLGNRHRVYQPLTRQAARIMLSIKGLIAKFRFVNSAIERELNRLEKKGTSNG